MLDTSVNFLKIYKKLDQLIKDTLQTDEGVTEYINMLAKLSLDGELEQLRRADYRGLKHIRWIRNKLVHEPDTLESGLCTSDDVIYTTDFYNRLMEGKDCLSVVAQRGISNINQGGGTFGNSQDNNRRAIDTGRSNDGGAFQQPRNNPYGQNQPFGNGQTQPHNNPFNGQGGNQTFGGGNNGVLGNQANNGFNGQPKYQNVGVQTVNNQSNGQSNNQPFGNQYGNQQVGTQRQGSNQPFGNHQSQTQGNNQPFGGQQVANNNPFAQKQVIDVQVQQTISVQRVTNKNSIATTNQANVKPGSQPFVAKPVAHERPAEPQPQQTYNWQQPTIKRAPVVTAEEANPEEDRPKSVFAKLVDKIKKLFS